MFADIHYALRQLGKSRGFAMVAVLTLALGIGVTTVAFTWMRAMVFAPLAVDQPERIVVIWSASPTRGIQRGSTSAADFVAWRSALAAVDKLAAVSATSYNLADARRSAARVSALRVSALRVSPEYFEVLGSKIAEGRFFHSRQAAGANAREVVLSHAFWTRHFGADRSIVGQAITLDDEAYTVVGIADDSLRLLPVDLWTPLDPGGDFAARDRRELIVLGRLEPGRSLEDARAELSVIAERLEQAYPDTNAGWTVRVEPWLRAALGPDTVAFFAVFTAAVLSVLLIGCANIGNLLLAKGLGRGPEVAIRLALGAARGRLIRQFLTESLVLSAIGGLAGLLIAVWLNDVLRGTILGSQRFAEGVRIDLTVLAFIAGISVIAALVFGTTPALQSSALRLQDSLRLGPASIARSARFRSRHTMVAAEVAIAAALLIVAGVLIRTGLSILRTSPGFDAANVLTARVSLPQTTYSRDRIGAFIRDAVTDLESQPGVERVAAASRLPLAGNVANANRAVDVEGYLSTDRDRPWAVDLVVTPGYFDTLRIPILEGRDFGRQDSAAAPGVVVVSETFASRYLQTGPSLGRRLRFGADGGWLTVVGVVADVRNDDLGQPPVPQAYVPYVQRPSAEMSLIVRTRGDPATFQPQIEAAVRRLDPRVAVYQVRTMEQVVMADIPDVPVIIGILSVCSTLALLLAIIGIYGVVAYTVQQQTREFAIRQALGAGRGQLVSTAMKRSVISTAAGLAAGVALALAVSRVLASAIDFVEGVDAVTLGVTLAILVPTVLAASWVPARAAMRVDPISALRTE